MSKKVKITDFKTERINKYTGGKIGDYVNKELCFEDEDNTNPEKFTLPNSFIAPDGTYLGDYAKGWWYFKNNMLVCFEYPHGVAIILKYPAKKYEYLEAYKTDGRVGGDDIKGYYGYSHRGGQTFKIGDRLFDETYEPKEEDYSKNEWAKFVADREKSILRNLKDGWYDNRQEAERDTPISDVIPFVKRGNKIIKTWEEAKQSAINMSKYLG